MRFSSPANTAISRGPTSGRRTSLRPAARARTAAATACSGLSTPRMRSSATPAATATAATSSESACTSRCRAGA
jgi:hypothetical protein